MKKLTGSLTKFLVWNFWTLLLINTLKWDVAVAYVLVVKLPYKFKNKKFWILEYWDNGVLFVFSIFKIVNLCISATLYLFSVQLEFD